MPKTTTTWLCPKCGASTVRDTSPGKCPACRRGTMRLHNVATEQPPVNPYAMTAADYPLARWLEDRNGIDNANAQGTLRSERKCFWCGADFLTFDPQTFIAMVFRAPLTFPVGAACEDCAHNMVEEGSIPAVSAPENVLGGMPQNTMNGAGVPEVPA